MTDIQYIYKQEVRRIGPDQVARFVDKLQELSQRYDMEEGKRPTHLVLGELEYATFRGLIAFQEALGNMTVDRRILPKGMEFCGLKILKANLPSLLTVADDNPEKER